MRGAAKSEQGRGLVTVEKLESVRICVREGCGRVLLLKQRRFCSRTCRNEMLKTGNGAGELLSKYKAEYAGSVFDKYIDDCDRKNKPTLTPTRGSYIVLNNACLPTNEGYARLIGVHVSTLNNWALKYSEFARVMDRLMRVQKEVLINNGLSRRYDSGLTRLMLASHHGIRMPKSEYVEKAKPLGVLRNIFGVS